MYKNLLYEEREKVAKITLNRPEHFNSLSNELKGELAEAILSVQGNPNLRCLILTGAGDKSFCPGEDLNETMDHRPEDVERFMKENSKVLNALRDLDKPYIAAVNGVAAGGGTEMALLADIIICSENARFGLTEINVGFGCVDGAALMWDVAGRMRTIDMILTGRLINAAEAKEWGIVSKVVPYAELEKESFAYAAVLAEKPPVALKHDKKWFRMLQEENYQKSLEYMSVMLKACYEAGEPNEYQRRFLEQRKERKAAK